MPIVTTRLKRKILKHQYTMDKQRCRIQKMDELPGVYFGEVKSIDDGNAANSGYLAFLIKDGKINVSDLLNKRDSKFDFVYDYRLNEFRGKGTVNFYRHCEKYVAYILLLLDELESENAHET